MSGLGNFLMLIQQGRPDVYSAFGDSAYNAQYLQCIWSYYISLIPEVDITDDQKICNNQIKPCRQAIEWSYGDIEASKKLPTWQEVALCYGAASRLPLIVEYLHVPSRQQGIQSPKT